MAVAGNGADTGPGPSELLAEALIAPAVLTMMSADRFGSAERMQLDNAIAFSPILRPMMGAPCGRLIERIVHTASEAGAEAVIARATEALSPALRETAICIALRVAFADGRIEESEEATVIVCSEAFGLPQAQFMKIYEVLAMLQRPADA